MDCCSEHYIDWVSIAVVVGEYCLAEEVSPVVR